MKKPLKKYIVRKYVMAKSAKDALKVEKNALPDDVWVDEDWKRSNTETVSAIGFVLSDPDK